MLTPLPISPSLCPAGGRTALALALYHQATEPYLVRQLLESGLGQRLALPRRMQLEDRYHGARPGFSVMHLAASKAQVTAGLMILLWCGPERCSRLRDEAGRSWMEVCPNAIVQSLLVEFAAVLEEWEAGPERHLLEELRAAGRGRLALGEKKRCVGVRFQCSGVSVGADTLAPASTQREAAGEYGAVPAPGGPVEAAAA